MIVEGVQRLVSGHIPQLDQFIIRACGHQGRIVVEARGAHPVAVAHQRARELAGGQAPNLLCNVMKHVNVEQCSDGQLCAAHLGGLII